MSIVVFAALLATLHVVAQGQLCNFSGTTFALPNFGRYSPTNDLYQPYAEYTPAAQASNVRLWQMNLCQAESNSLCQRSRMASSYVYGLADAEDGSEVVCDVGLSSFSGWFQSTALDSDGNRVKSMNATFTNEFNDYVAQVAIICGGTSAQLTPVSFPGANHGWYTYISDDATAVTLDVVFQFPIPGFCGSETQPASASPIAPNTSAPPSNASEGNATAPHLRRPRGASAFRVVMMIASVILTYGAVLVFSQRASAGQALLPELDALISAGGHLCGRAGRGGMSARRYSTLSFDDGDDDMDNQPMNSARGDASGFGNTAGRRADGTIAAAAASSNRAAIPTV